MNKIQRVYLDYNATSPLDSEVRDVLLQELDNEYANASSLHEDGRSIAKKIEKARDSVLTLIGAYENGKPTGSLVFTSGGSESNNTVLMSMISYAQKTNRKTVLVSAIEHPCVLESAAYLETLGFTVYRLPVDADGVIDKEEYARRLTENPILVSIMTANNEIGTIQDIKTLCDMAHKAGALFHTDAVQAAGKMVVNAADWNVDYMTLSCHKIYGPKGVGALYIKNGAPYTTFIRGGHQEHGRRAGTYNGPGIIAFGIAADLARVGLADYESHTRRLRNMLRDSFLRDIPKIRINGHPEHVLPNTLDVSFPGAEGEAILLHLDLAGISVSTGSACASGSLEPSHVLMATGLGPELAHGSIRFSMGKYTTEKEIQYVCDTMPGIIEKLRKFSTVGY